MEVCADIRSITPLSSDARRWASSWPHPTSCAVALCASWHSAVSWTFVSATSVDGRTRGRWSRGVYSTATCRTDARSSRLLLREGAREPGRARSRRRVRKTHVPP
eukprot:2757289-Prymnesium_polylepis.1